MKFLIASLAVIFCFTAAYASNTPPAIPASLPGYTGFSLAQVKKNSIILNTFIAQTSNFIIRSINEKKIVPSSYSVFLRYAFRKSTGTGFEMVYYVRTYDPRNPNGKIYYGTFTVTTSATGGSRTFKSYSIDKSFPRNA